MLLLLLLGIGFFCGVVGVACNPSSCFAVCALVVGGGIGCGIVALAGGFYLALVMFLVYLGGMLVAFAYSVALSSDLYPKAPDSGFGIDFIVFYSTFLGFTSVGFGQMVWSGGCHHILSVASSLDSGFGGICYLYGVGGWSLLVVVVGLLLTLFIVLELVRGVTFGALSGV